MADLKSDFRVTRYDLRGHGLSDPWKEPFSPIQDMMDVLDRVGLARPAIVGLSAGAELAIDFALEYPDRVSALVLASPGLGGYEPVGSFDWMAPVMAKLTAGDPEGAMQEWTETPIMWVRMSSSVDSVTRAQVQENWRIWSYDPSFQRRPDPPAIGRLSELDLPVLILVGTEDLIDTKRVADTLSVCLQNARLVPVPGAGHLVNLDAPEFFRDALQRFLNSDTQALAGGADRGC